MIQVGCASWRLPKALQTEFPGGGTHLTRYAGRLPAVEINSSFYNHHRAQLYAKWASEVPEAFRFAVKMPRWLTHNQRLRDTEGLDAFLEEIQGLGGKLGPLLMQLPPSLKLEPDNAGAFLEAVRQRHDGALVCEPRHGSWFSDEGEALLSRFQVSRVAADPPPVDGADAPGGYEGRVYVRLHGRPQKFYGEYDEGFLQALAERLNGFSTAAEAWCVFNNTAAEGGHRNALSLWARLGSQS